MKAGEGGRTLDIHVGNENDSHAQEAYIKRVTTSTHIARSAGAAVLGHRTTDHELQALISAWPSLPPVIKAGILAMVRATPV
jgi:hypothetical protein